MQLLVYVDISCIYCYSCYIKLDKSGRNNYLNFKFAITKKIKKRCFKVLILGIAKFLKFEFIIHRKEINVKI